MSLKRLEEAIENLEKLIEKAKEQSDFYEVDSSFNQWFKDFKIRFETFKTTHMCIPRKQLEERIRYLASMIKPHGVCCVQCLERGQIMELQKIRDGKLLEESKKKE